MLLSQNWLTSRKGMPMYCVKRWGKSKGCLDKMKPKFISQAVAKGHPDKLEKYGKTGKPLLSMLLINHTLPVMLGLYQTAYLKYYPAEYMARYCLII
jgi:DNA polymerase-3 subunit alpha